jgi:hypothetical protein
VLQLPSIIAGLIVATIQVRPAWTEALKNLAAQRIPVVVLGASRPSANVIHIAVDDVKGFVKATSHLLDLGHDRNGMITPPARSKWRKPARDRLFAGARPIEQNGDSRVAHARRMARHGRARWRHSPDVLPASGRPIVPGSRRLPAKFAACSSDILDHRKWELISRRWDAA